MKIGQYYQARYVKSEISLYCFLQNMENKIFNYSAFLGAFMLSREKESVGFVISVRPSSRIYHRGSHWMDFRENLYSGLFTKKSVKNLQIYL